MVLIGNMDSKLYGATKLMVLNNTDTITQNKHKLNDSSAQSVSYFVMKVTAGR